jgi:hypothetical protein
MLSPLRLRMIEDMKLAGLAASTQEAYVDAVYRLAAHYRRSPDQLSEEEVRQYLLALCEQGAARGTFKLYHYGIQFLYRQTLAVDWPLFSKKSFGRRGRSGCRRSCPTRKSGGFWPGFAARFTAPAFL